MSLGDLRDIGDHYAAIAGAAARLAAERSSTEDIQRLELATADLRSATGVEVSRAERQFHLEVAAAAQSPRLTQEEVALQAGVRRSLMAALAASPARTGAPRDHRRDRRRGRRLRRGRQTEEHVLDAVDRLAELHLDLWPLEPMLASR